MPFIELESVDSTNNYAFKQLHEGLAHHGTAYFAREQLAGKGQRGKSWTAAKDSGLIMSIVMNPRPLLLIQQFQLSALVAVAACELLRKYTDDSVCIKWPNDLYWQDRKAGGILIENIIGGQRSDSGFSPDELNQTGQISTVNSQPTSHWLWAVIGIGINVNQTSFGEELRNPVSMKQITGKDFSPVELAKELCLALDDYFTRLRLFGFETIYSSYLSFLYKKSESVRLRKGNRAFDATIKTVSNTGRLVVKHAIEEEFDFGEIDWVIPVNVPKN